MLNRPMNHKTASLLNWLAVTASIAALAAVILNVHQRGIFSRTDDQELVVSSPPRPVSKARVDMQEIIDAHLFGQVPAKSKPQKQQVVAPKTKLKLTLTGIFEYPADEKGRAIIDVAGGKAIVLKVGDQIARTGARLHEIEANHVLIERNGNLEQLPMVRKQMQGMSALVASMQSAEEQDMASLPQPREEVYELPEPEPEQILQPEPNPQQEAIVPDAGPQGAAMQGLPEAGNGLPGQPETDAEPGLPPVPAG